MYKTSIEYKAHKLIIIVLILMSSCTSDKGDIDRGLLAWFPFNGNAVNMVDGYCDELSS